MRLRQTSKRLEELNRDGLTRLETPMPDAMLRALDHVFETNHVLENAGPQAPAARRLGAANDNASVPLQAVLHFLRAFQPLEQALVDILGPRAVAVRMQFLRGGGQDGAGGVWHQNITITAQNSHPLPPGFGPVRIEAGIPHITAPREFLQGLLEARLYLDNADSEQGVEEISPGSHRRGRIARNVLAMMPHIEPCQALRPQRGEVYLLRPLLLRRFTGIKPGAGARCIQIDLAPVPKLPAPLTWHAAIPFYAKGRL